MIIINDMKSNKRILIKRNYNFRNVDKEFDLGTVAVLPGKLFHSSILLSINELFQTYRLGSRGKAVTLIPVTPHTNLLFLTAINSVKRIEAIYPFTLNRNFQAWKSRLTCNRFHFTC